MFSGRGLCDGLITRPEESYRLQCVVVCDLENSRMRRPWPTGDCRAKKKETMSQEMHMNKIFYLILFTDMFRSLPDNHQGVVREYKKCNNDYNNL